MKGRKNWEVNIKISARIAQTTALDNCSHITAVDSNCSTKPRTFWFFLKLKFLICVFIKNVSKFISDKVFHVASWGTMEL